MVGWEAVRLQTEQVEPWDAAERRADDTWSSTSTARIEGEEKDVMTWLTPRDKQRPCRPHGISPTRAQVAKERADAVLEASQLTLNPFHFLDDRPVKEQGSEKDASSQTSEKDGPALTPRTTDDLQRQKHSSMLRLMDSLPEKCLCYGGLACRLPVFPLVGIVCLSDLPPGACPCGSSLVEHPLSHPQDWNSVWPAVSRMD
ncbi:hypothetical protein NDU88_002063 [Pleurodeles waltl]|uniref:Uncharacterized protein n=1 Tax=Pleurodeles waltl TaxID=8319 RepID=A0AAV7WK66_PLEWA|nr:hypothetical protein NDU88_002063 [Pleurodeles waltl]